MTITWRDLFAEEMEIDKRAAIRENNELRFQREPVDLALLPEFMLGHTAHRLSRDVDEEDYDSDKHRVPASLEEADVIDSQVVGTDEHRPVLDIDFPAALIPSSTPGHFHLYLDHELDWEDYEKLLTVLGDVGILEEGYVAAAKRRGYTSARLPWVTKGTHDNG